jgi:hypothetical protein
MKNIVAILLLCFAQLLALADSPLTSTFFASAYNDVPIIKSLLIEREKSESNAFRIQASHLRFFDDISVSLDQKVALVNAFGWGDTINTEVFIAHIMKKYSIGRDVIDGAMTLPSQEDLDLPNSARVLSFDDMIILGYIQIMGDYFQPLRGFRFLTHAATNNEASEASVWIFGLMCAQIYMDMDWCKVYTSMVEVRDNYDYTTNLLRADAKTAIFDYIGIYQEMCVVDELGNLSAAVENPYVINPYKDPEFQLPYYVNNPVYTKPAAPQVSDKKNGVDLALKTGDKDQMLENWVFYEEAMDGTTIKVQVLNKGNTRSIETNLLFRNIGDGSAENPDFYYQVAIPSIPAGASREISIDIPSFWIYDPDAQFQIILDYDGNISEPNEENNMQSFFQQG